MAERTGGQPQRPEGTGGQPPDGGADSAGKPPATGRWPSVGQLIGENLRRLRLERALTQEDAARAVREVGLPWTRRHVATLETAVREDLTIGELVLLSRAFDVPLAEWFCDPKGREVQLIRGTRVRARGIREAGIRMAGLRSMFEPEPQAQAQPERLRRSPPSGLRTPRPAGDVWLVGQASSLVGPLARGDEILYSLAERKAAGRLGWSCERVRDMAERRWHSTLDAERDRRVGASSGSGRSSIGARRGHVTRTLISELRDIASRLQRFQHRKGSYRGQSDEFEADTALAESMGFLRRQPRGGSR